MFADPHDPIVAAARRIFPVPLEQARSIDLTLPQFIRDAWHIVEPRNEFVPGPHLDMICEHLVAITRGQIQDLLINIPPRHMKSLAVCVFWPAWEWINFPHRRWLFASYAQSLATRDSLRCRRLIESPWYQKNFANCFALREDQNTKKRFENDKGGHRIATSSGGSATGEGGDRVVVDDPHNVIDRESDAQRQRTLIWWDETMSTRLNDPKTGAKVIVMQRIHEKDLSGHVLEQGGYVHLCLPAEFEPTRKCITILGEDWRTSEGQLLWPDRVGAKQIAKLKKALGPIGFAGQFQQRPAPASGAIFQAAWFRYFSIVHLEEQNLRMEDGGLRIAAGENTRMEDRGSRIARSESDDDAHSPCAPSSILNPLSSNSSPTAPSSIHNPPSSNSLLTTYRLIGASGDEQLISADECRRFATMDPAGTEAGANDACYTVIQVWDLTPTGDMLLIHQYRQQVQAPDAAAAAIRISREFDCEFIGIEKDGLGLGIVQTVKRSGVTVRPIKAHGCKEARAQIAQIRMHNGQIYFPRGAAFLHDLETELLQFPQSQYLDQADALSHAAILVSRLAGVARIEEVATC